ncbi:MAG: tripartite tricarboxylate transporter substrate binding protein [Casimicrobiaceae bacterium]
MFKKLVVVGMVFALIGVYAPNVLADEYPARPIHIVVPYVPGGASDIFARLIAQKLTERTKIAVIVDNRPGAGGTIGAEFVAHSKPDGYTLLLSDDSVYSIAPSLYANLTYKAADLIPVLYVATSPQLLITASSSHLTSFKELLAQERAKPGKLNIASSGNGTGSHLSLVLLNYLAGTHIQHIPYRGGGAALNDVLSGHTDMMFIGTPPAMPFVANGQIRVLAVSSTKRFAGLPDVPTIAESGVPGFEAVAGQGLFAPAGTPSNIVKWLNESIAQINATPDMRKRWTGLGAEVIGMTPLQYKAWLDQESTKWRKMIDAAGIHPD